MIKNKGKEFMNELINDLNAILLTDEPVSKRKVNF